jgi:ActR/RegA family two-component response regulator
MGSAFRQSSRPLDGVLDTVGDRGKSRVLVVDRDAAVRATLKTRLGAEGFDVGTASTVEQIVALVDRTVFDVVILDLKLQGAQGLDLVSLVRHRWAGTLVVLLDGVGGQLTRATARRWGAVACFPKPVPISDLAGVLHALVVHSIAPPATLGFWSALARDDRAAPVGSLRIIVHATRGRGVAPVLDAVAAATATEPIVVVVARHDAARVEASVAGSSAPTDVLVQPRDRGSAAAVLLAAYWIARRDPDATLAVVPERHRGVLGPALGEVLKEAARFVNRYPRWILLLGRRPRGRTVGSWIMPGPVLDCSETVPVWRVASIRDEPASSKGQDGAPVFRDTGILVAKAARLMSDARRLLPALHQALLQAVPLLGSDGGAGALGRAYALVPRLDFARAMVAASVTDVAVAEPSGAAWLVS